MSTYYTKGQKHRTGRADYDAIYNAGYVWTPLFTHIVRELVSNGKELELSDHVRNYRPEGNRAFNCAAEITRNAILAGDVVEVETAIDDYDGEDIDSVRKAVIRLPKRADGEQVVVVVDFRLNGQMKAKTAWLNKATDNHQSGLDTSEFERTVNGRKFGYFLPGFRSKAFKIEHGRISAMKDDVMITMAEYYRRRMEKEKKG